MMVKTGTLNQWGEQCEYQADAASVRYLYASKVYNPVAMLTVTEGLAQMEDSGPKVDMGIDQDHPYGKDAWLPCASCWMNCTFPSSARGAQGDRRERPRDREERQGSRGDSPERRGDLRTRGGGGGLFAGGRASGVRICSIPCCCGNSNQWTSPRHSRTKAPCSCKPKAKPCLRSCPGTRRSTRRRWTNYPSRP